MSAVPAVLTIVGSLRSESWNRRLVDHAASRFPPPWSTQSASLAHIPLYDQDLETAGAPESVAALRVAVAGSDAVLIATPQYNHGIPGVLKNAIDWLSRPAFAGVFVGKPVTVMACGPGRTEPTETIRQTENALEVCLARVMRPGLAIASIGHQVDEAGTFDASVTEAIDELVARFVDFATEETES